MVLPTENTKDTKIRIPMKLDDKSQQIKQITQIIKSVKSVQSDVKKNNRRHKRHRKRFVLFVSSVGNKKKKFVVKNITKPPFILADKERHNISNTLKL